MNDVLYQETYDPQSYWELAGKTYEQDASLGEYEHQERVLRVFLQSLKFHSVLEVGCGFGRVGALITSMYPDVSYTGVDISRDQLVGAIRRIRSGARFWKGMFQDFPETSTYDLVIAVEVLMHVPPKDVAGVIEKMFRMSSHYVVSIDSDEVGAEHYHWYNFPHDYREIYGDRLVGEWAASPEDRTRQTLFFAEKKAVIAL